jgi:Fe2+ or Zn2+ uptake regulation protein
MEKQGIKPNSNRIAVLQELLETGKAFSLCSLSQILKGQMDRTTVYRILILLTENKLVQKIPCSDGNSLYVFNSDETNNSTNFRCKCCQKVETLPSLPDEYLKILSMQKINLEAVAFEGYCKNCSR